MFSWLSFAHFHRFSSNARVRYVEQPIRTIFVTDCSTWIQHAQLVNVHCPGTAVWNKHHKNWADRWWPDVNQRPTVGLVACSSHTEVTFKPSIFLLVKQWLNCNWTRCIIWMGKSFSLKFLLVWIPVNRTVLTRCHAVKQGVLNCSWRANILQSNLFLKM